MDGRGVTLEVDPRMILASEGVQEKLAGRTDNGHRRCSTLGLKRLITPPQYHAHGRGSEGAPPEPAHHTPDVGFCLGIELSGLPGALAPADVFVVDEEFVGVAGPVECRVTQR
jgi:hypothetical protein